jgi:hypothetical protein
MLRAPNRRYSTFWTTRGAPGSGAQELIAHRKARQITIADADGFFRNLAQRITILAKTRKQSPLSIDLLVSSIKRYLAKPEYRIQLDEVVAHEVERLVQQLGTQRFVNSQQSPQLGAINGQQISLPGQSLVGGVAANPNGATRYVDVQMWAVQYIDPTTDIDKFISGGRPVNPAVAEAAFGAPTYRLRRPGRRH